MIAKPNFVDGRFQRYSKGNTVVFDTMIIGNSDQTPLKLTVAGNSVVNREWVFGIECYANTDANLELLLEQTMVRLLAYSGTNARWVILGVGAFSSKYGQRACYVNCQEQSVVAPSAW